MLQSRYPSLLNLSNFVSLPQYESKFQDQEITLDNLYKLIGALHDNTSPSTNESQAQLPPELQFPTSIELYLAIASYCKLIILHPHLNSLYLSLPEIYKIWEVRLNLLLMSTNLKLPSSKSVIPTIPNAKYLRTEGNALLNELMKIKKVESEEEQEDDDDNGDEEDDNTLPKEINWGFKLLINRIKNGSGLLLLNYYYNLLLSCRKRQDLDRIKSILFSLSSLLIARQQYLTLFNLLNQYVDEAATTDDPQLISNVCLLSALVGLLMVFKDNNSIDKDSIYYDEILTIFNKVNPDSINSLIDVLAKVAPIYTSSLAKIQQDTIHIKSLDDINDVSKLVEELKITGRIVCSLCAQFEIESKTASVALPSPVIDMDGCLNVVSVEWMKNVNNYYAYE